jgi:hypothetical protein
MMPPPRPNSLSPEEIALFQALNKSSIVYMLMRRLDCPLGAREIANMLGIHEQTAAKYLRNLESLNLVARSGNKCDYVLLAGRQIVLTSDEQPLPSHQSDSQSQQPAVNGQPVTKNSQQADHHAPERDAPRMPIPAGLPGSLPGPSAEHTHHAEVVTNISQQADDPSPAAMKISQQSPDAGALTVPNAGKTQQPMDQPAQTMKKTQHPLDLPAQTVPNVGKTQQPIINNNIINNKDNQLNDSNESEDELLLIIDDATKNSQLGDDYEKNAVWQELYAAGIYSNARTRALVQKPHITADYVRAHRLKLEASGKGAVQWAGLLVMILESGQPAPELNPNGHLTNCKCRDCFGYNLARSWEDP